jgi:hypothetical protein
VTQGDAVQYFTDLSSVSVDASLKKKLKLWFYISRRDLRNKRSALGYARDPGPDGMTVSSLRRPPAPNSAGPPMLRKSTP